QQQERGVQRVRPVALDERPPPRVPALCHHLLEDRVAGLLPPPPVGRQRPLVGQPHAAVHRHPAQDPGVDEVPPPAADLPDPLVLPLPVVAHPVHHPPQPHPVVVPDRGGVLVEQVHRV